MSATTAVQWGVEMSDGTFEWYDDREWANRFSTMKRSGLDPTGRIVKRELLIRIDESEYTPRSDFTGCGVWDGQPGSGYCCDLPNGHSGPHHADHFWAASDTDGERSGE